MDYPHRAHEALLRIESLISTKNQDHVLDLISEFIFYEKKSDSRKYGNTHKNQQTCGLSLIQEFQLVVVLCEFYERPGQEMIRNAVFLSLFERSNAYRLKVLSKLIGTAIASSVAPILMAAGTWIQQVGPTNTSCLELTQKLIEDFIVFSNKGPEQLKNLPAISPRFSINFLVCCTDLYLNDTKSHQLMPPPPPALLEIFTNWMLDYPTLCTDAQPQLALPQGAISMPIVSPLPGLIRWCVLAPISNASTDGSAYSKLHLAILKSLMQESKSVNDLPPASAINSVALGVVIFALKFRATEIGKTGDIDTDEKMQLSLERLAQCIQIALQSRSLTGNVSQMISKLKMKMKMKHPRASQF
ncbi:uncharacterized protein C7orf26 homolog [Bradysia coprophila]|uniref:uncharacterized protein C7orf26 homolog n=1 Tax=Bradysia coprophila TaxID=38358 RepID=UPI00187D7300|nr:uncharacterized protein C7orf26 homolog [Bradysia coprophila]